MTETIARYESVRSAARATPAGVVDLVAALSRLDSALTTPVVLVCAPAGYGKSKAVARWVDRRLGDAAWVNLASVGEDPAVVWGAVLRALASARPSRSDGLDGLSRLAQRTPAEVPAGLALWVCRQRDDVFLVLDDLHTVTDSDVHEQLVEFIASAAPRLRLIAVTRHDPPWPLPRMRLDGLVLDLRSDLLTFGQEEATQLFVGQGLQLTTEQVQHLVRLTEGWAAGLRLAALGAAAAPDSERYVNELSGRTDYIADYLLREVYERLDPGWQQMLARIGVVEELCAELAAALGAGADSGGRLDELVQQNVFIEQVRDRPGWYRLHPLLLDFIRSRATDTTEQRRLHRLAADWFRAQDDPDSALRHALRAHAWDLAAELVGENIVTWTVVRSPRRLIALLASAPREEVLTHLGLAAGLAAAHSMLGESAALPELLAAARTQLGRLGPGPLRHRYEVLLELIEIGARRWAGDVEGVLACCRRIDVEPHRLAELGLADWLTLRTLVVNNQGCSELWVGQLDAARHHLAEAARTDDNRCATLPVLNARAHLAFLYLITGDLDRAEELGRCALEGFEELGAPTAVQARCAYLARAGVALDRADVSRARRWLDAGADAQREPHTDLVADLVSAQIQAAEGQLFEAVTASRRARERTEHVPVPDPLKDAVVQLEAQLLSQTGNVSGARAARVPASTRAGCLAPPERSIRGRVTAGLAAVRRHLATGDQAAALDTLEHTLAVAAPQQLRRPFLVRSTTLRHLLSQRVELGTVDPEFAIDLLERMSKDAPDQPASAGLLAPLTERELNMLRFLATTLTTREIADKLYVSVNTVKTHQRAIHQKLGANDRRTAVAHARELGLL